MSGNGPRGKGAKAETADLKKAAKAERRLLREEQAAERRLAEARARLAKSETRFQRRQAAVAAAAAELRERQAARAVGPEAAPTPAPAPVAAEPTDLGEDLVVVAGLATPATKRKRAPRATAAPVLLPDGSVANGAATDGLLEIGSSRSSSFATSAAPARRRRKTAAT